MFRALFSLVLIAFVSCAAETAAVPLPPEPETLEDTALSADDRLLVDLVNELRSTGCRCGNRTYPAVAPVVWNQRLDTAAARHATDMHRNQEMTHTGSDGSSVGDRVTRTGYRWRTVAENVAWGYRDVESVFRGWKDSPGHCKNILNAEVREMGFGRSGDYWAQTFATQFN